MIVPVQRVLHMLFDGLLGTIEFQLFQGMYYSLNTPFAVLNEKNKVVQSIGIQSQDNKLTRSNRWKVHHSQKIQLSPDNIDI